MIICLEGGKHSDVTWLYLVGGMRRKSNKDDVILMAKLHCLQGFVRPVSIIDEYSWPTVGSILGLWIEHFMVSV